MHLNTLEAVAGILANLSFVGGFLVSLYALRKPETRQHLQLALKNVAYPTRRTGRIVHGDAE